LIFVSLHQGKEKEKLFSNSIYRFDKYDVLLFNYLISFFHDKKMKPVPPQEQNQEQRS
jgi:hypothetical protein